MSLELTEKSAKEIKTIISQQNLPEETFLRLGVRGGGCSGFSYNLDLSSVKNELDEEFESFGIKIICDPKSYLYLEGTVLDFKDDELIGRGFVFNNPNSTHRCGCGSSFSV